MHVRVRRTRLRQHSSYSSSYEERRFSFVELNAAQAVSTRQYSFFNLLPTHGLR